MHKSEQPGLKGGLEVHCSSEWGRDAAQKVEDTISRALAAGMLHDDWSIKIQRRQGGRLKVFLETDATET